MSDQIRYSDSIAAQRPSMNNIISGLAGLDMPYAQSATKNGAHEAKTPTAMPIRKISDESNLYKKPIFGSSVRRRSSIPSSKRNGKSLDTQTTQYKNVDLMKELG